MPSTKKVLKTGGRGVLSVTIVATKCAKYGLSFTTGLVKQLFGGAQNMANSFAPSPSLGIGSYLLNATEKATSKGFDLLISAQKAAKEALK